ncbi:MAG TPA: flippase [Bacteroidetes bacterium]|nr:flippase [Bacteroidota bacterium]
MSTDMYSKYGLGMKININFIATLANAFLSWIALSVVAHYMGPTVLGTIAYALAFVGLFTILSDMGFAGAHLKRVSEGNDLKICNGTFLTIKLLLSLFAIMVVLLIIIIPKHIAQQIFFSSEQDIVLIIVLFSVILHGLATSISYTFLAQRKIAKSVIPFFTGRVIQTLLQIFIAVSALGVIALAGTYLAEAIIALLIVSFFFRYYPISRPSREYLRSYFIIALPYLFIGAIQGMLFNFDKIMIQAFSTVEEVGFYVAPQRICFSLIMLSSSVMALLFPSISASHAAGHTERVRKLSRTAERYISLLSAPIAVFVLFFASDLVYYLFGHQFFPSVMLFKLLIIATFIMAITDPFSIQLTGTDKMNLAAKISVVILLANIGLNTLLIPQKIFGVALIGLGATGAAIGTIISVTLGAFLYRFFAYKIMEMKQNWNILFHLLAAGIAGGIVYSLFIVLQAAKWYNLIACSLLYFNLYILILWILHEITREDLKFFRAIIDFKEMRDYMVSELKERET